MRDLKDTRILLTKWKFNMRIIAVLNLNNTIIFVNEVETKYEKNHSGAAKPRISTIQKTKLVTK
jgi:hypothetical protein